MALVGYFQRPIAMYSQLTSLVEDETALATAKSTSVIVEEFHDAHA